MIERNPFVRRNNSLPQIGDVSSFNDLVTDFRNSWIGILDKATDKRTLTIPNTFYKKYVHLFNCFNYMVANSASLNISDESIEVDLCYKFMWLSRVIDSTISMEHEAGDSRQWFSLLSKWIKFCGEFSQIQAQEAQGVETYRLAYNLPPEVESKHFCTLPALQACGLEIAKIAGLTGQTSVMEIGSGMGISRDIIPAAVPVAMTDFNPFFCAANVAAHPNSPVFLRDAWDLKFRDKQFDAVLEFGVLDIADRFNDILREIRRVGKRFIHLMDLGVDENTDYRDTVSFEAFLENSLKRAGFNMLFHGVISVCSPVKRNDLDMVSHLSAMPHITRWSASAHRIISTENGDFENPVFSTGEHGENVELEARMHLLVADTN
jgi:hypothetical protein